MNLSELRREKKLTQAALADLVGVRRETIARYEIGERLPSRFIVNRLAETLSVTVSDIVLAIYGCNQVERWRSEDE